MLDLLVAMGYAGGRGGTEHLGKSGDGGSGWGPAAGRTRTRPDLRTGEASRICARLDGLTSGVRRARCKVLRPREGVFIDEPVQSRRRWIRRPGGAARRPRGRRRADTPHGRTRCRCADRTDLRSATRGRGLLRGVNRGIRPGDRSRMLRTVLSFRVSRNCRKVERLCSLAALLLVVERFLFCHRSP